MAKKFYIIVGSPLSDIGKGWLAASIASLLPEVLLIKIDPLLNNFNTEKKDIIAHPPRQSSPDDRTYRELGIPFTMDQLFYSGNILRDFLAEHTVEKNEKLKKKWKRLTFSDVSEYFARSLLKTFQCSGKRSIVAEIGGSVFDKELVYIAPAIRQLAHTLHRNLKIILLSYLDYSEDVNYPIKMQIVVQGIEQTRRIYGEPSLVFFRRRKLSQKIEENIDNISSSIAARALFPRKNLIYLPNFSSPVEEREFIQKLAEFQ